MTGIREREPGASTTTLRPEASRNATAPVLRSTRAWRLPVARVTEPPSSRTRKAGVAPFVIRTGTRCGGKTLSALSRTRMTSGARAWSRSLSRPKDRITPSDCFCTDRTCSARAWGQSKRAHATNAATARIDPNGLYVFFNLIMFLLMSSAAEDQHPVLGGRDTDGEGTGQWNTR